MIIHQNEYPFRGLVLNKITVISLLLLYSSQCLGQSTKCIEQAEFSKIQAVVDTIINSELDSNEYVPGISIHISSSKHCYEYEKAYGFLSLDKRQKLKSAHVFRIASNTKTYTAATALRLHEKKLIDIDQSISQYLPEIFIQALQKSGVEVSKVTVRNLLNHTAGLPDHAQDPRYFEQIKNNPSKLWTPLEQVKLLNTFNLSITEPNKEFSYSDTGYILLGQIIEKVTNLSLNDAYTKFLDFERLNIRSSWIEGQNVQLEKSIVRAHQYFDTVDTFNWNASLDLHGGGGLLSTAKDMSLFTEAIMKSRIFKLQETQAMMTTPTLDSSSMGFEYGMGLFKKRLGKFDAWGHTGFWNSFSYHIPQFDFTISGVISQNKGISGSKLVEKILSRLNQKELLN